MDRTRLAGNIVAAPGAGTCREVGSQYGTGTVLVRSIQAKMIGVVLGAALVVALCAGLFVDQMRRNIERQVQADQAAVAQTYAGLVDEYLTGAKQTADALAEQPALRAPLLTAEIKPELEGIPPEADPERRAAIARHKAAFLRMGATTAADNSSATEQVATSAREMNDQIVRIADEADQLTTTSSDLRPLVARFRLEQAVEAPAGRGTRPSPRRVS